MIHATYNVLQEALTQRLFVIKTDPVRRRRVKNLQPIPEVPPQTDWSQVNRLLIHRKLQQYTTQQQQQQKCFFSIRNLVLQTEEWSLKSDKIKNNNNKVCRKHRRGFQSKNFRFGLAPKRATRISGIIWKQRNTFMRIRQQTRFSRVEKQSSPLVRSFVFYTFSEVTVI